ncbi:MAG: nitroreductase family protein [Pseudonocardiaceae bacterium]
MLFEPRTRRAFSALGKDVVPDAVAVLADAAGGASRTQLLQRHKPLTPGNLDSLVDSRLLTARSAAVPESASTVGRSPSFLATFHTANVDYPFFDYGSPSAIEDESQLLDYYAKLWPAPPAIAPRAGRRYALPPANREQDQELTLSSLGWLLMMVLSPVGEIRTRHVTCIRRTVPSGGARHPTELVVMLRQPLGQVPVGAYSYDVATHALIAEPSDMQEAYAAGVPDGGFGIVVRSRVERTMWRYRDLRALRPLLIDAGHIVEMVTFLLARLGIAAEVASATGAALGENWLDEPEVALIRSVAAGVVNSARPLAVPSVSAHGAVLTNPALTLRFGPRLAADVLWPVPRNVPLDLTDFLVLNHCLPSTRGDRDTSVQGVVAAAAGATEKSIQRLRDAGALLAVRDAKPLYAGSRLWVRHEWYLALLAYLESRSHGLIAPVASLVPQDGAYVDDLAVIRHRRTTRAFDDAALATDSVETLLRGVFLDGLPVGVEVSLAIWRVSGLAAGLYRWRSGRLKRIGDAPERVAVARASAGQTAASTGAFALWISSRTDLGQPARYVMDLVDLGRLGQRICLAGAELGIGVFLTPAVHDSETCSLLGLADADRRLTYVFGLGVPRYNKSAVNSDSGATPHGLTRRRTD